VLVLLTRIATAQWSASATVVSDLRFRGVSLSDERPQALLQVDADARNGSYAGAMLSAVHFDEQTRSSLLQVYFGTATPLGPTLSSDIGLSYSHFASSPSYDYLELHGSLNGPRWHMGLYASPNYFGNNYRSLYVEADAFLPLATAWRVLAHVGQLRANTNSLRADARVGLAWQEKPCEVQFAWVGAGQGGPEPSAYGQRRRTAVLSVTFIY